MDWKDLAKTVTGIAPILGGVLGGPPGAAIGGVISGIAKIFGLGDDATPDQIDQAIKTDPQAALKLRIAEMDFQLAKQDMFLKDIQDARNRQVQVERATGKRDINLYVLAWVIIGGFIGLIAALIVLELVFARTVSANPLISLLVGSLSTDAGMVVGYFFGSSKGSAEKTELMAGIRGRPIE